MQNFTKAERLSSKIDIEKLVKTKHQFHLYPFKISWISVLESDVPVKVLITVPKRNFKKAVDRNKLKRRTKEAYRKKKSILINELNGKKIFLMIFYSSKTIEKYAVIEEKIILLLKKLDNQINNHEE